MRPSFLAASLSGLVLLYATILLICDYKELSKDNFIIILFLMALGYGVHGIQHSYEEIYYDFNPFVGKWKISDDPKKMIF